LPETGPSHVLVVDIGGGTSDFSLFAVSSETPASLPRIQRVAVSDHLLLGGDNIDLALAHQIQPRLGPKELSLPQWNYLVARCRDLKERCLGSAEGDDFPMSIPAAGSSLLGKTLAARVPRTEIESIVLEGFFPDCEAGALPSRTRGGLMEWHSCSRDSAVTRYLADFLRVARVDALLV
jgi:molecular chaperone DnaK (HSP70)